MTRSASKEQIVLIRRNPEDEAASETDNYKTEKRFFKLSLLYLFAHFGAILVEAGLSRFGLGGW